MVYALSELIEELKQCQNSRLDVVSDQWSAVARGRYMMIRIDDHGSYGLTDHAHEQLSQIIDIPKRYYDRLKSGNQELLRTNLNAWIDKPLLFRILDDKIIAVMSDRYRIIDHYDVLMCTLDTIKKKHHHGVKVHSCELTDTKMYIKMIQPENKFKIIKNDEITPGIVIQNSEVGAGAVRADMYITSERHGNSMIGSLPVRRTHKGTKIEPGVVKSDTRDETLWAWVSDMISAAFDPRPLNRFAAMIRDNTETISEKPIETVDLVCSDHRLTEQQKTITMNYFLQFGDRTKWSLANAVSMAAKGCDDMDNKIMLERIAGKIAAEPRTMLQTPLT